MKLEELLMEIPRDIGNIDWHFLNKVDQNKEFYKELAANKYKKVIEKLTPTATVYRIGSQYFCLDLDFKQVTYYMKFEVGNNGKIGSYVWQSLVWTNDSFEYTKHYPQKIFFRDLLPKFGNIITDSEQTWDGKRFWVYRIIDAFNMGLNVYFYDFGSHNIIKMNDMNDFVQAQSTYDIWGVSNAHSMKRMIITKNQLPIVRKQR